MTKTNRKRTFSLALTLCVAANYLPAVHAAGAEQPAKYPYAVFAVDDQLGVSLTLDNLTLNGNGYTNGTVSNTAKSGNLNGRISVPNVDAAATTDEAFDVKTDMIHIHKKLMNSYFADDELSFDEDYALSDMNNNINEPIYVVGKLSIDGNLALNAALGAVSDITLTNGNINCNNAVLYSKFGNICIDAEQVSVNGLIYAPFGNVIIDCANCNVNGLIIAQNVIVTGSGANINYNDSIAQFVGTETESLSWSMDDFKFLADTDADGLPDVIEKEYKTDPFVADTDGDTLPDGYEVFTLETEPLVLDTDTNGINDNEEDFDKDDLNNGDEYLQGTDPFCDDSDHDSLYDGDEVKKYGTNPLVIDTDSDGLDDPDELFFNSDPNVRDTDGNGILDGDEKRAQTFTHEADDTDSAVTKVTVTMNGTGNLQKTTKIESLMNRDFMCTNVVGLVGAPYSIETTSQFDTAAITFTVDQTKLGETKFEDLLFLWYDEANHEFVELDTIYDAASSTVSVETTHFSKYMVVDKIKWFEAWAVTFNYNPGANPNTPAVPNFKYNTVLAIDCSGSMATNDPIRTMTVNSPSDAKHPFTCGRIKAADGFIEYMNSSDQAAVVLFTSSASITQSLTNNEDDLKAAVQKVNSSGGTSFDAAISKSIAAFSEDDLDGFYTYNRILLLSDVDAENIHARYDMSTQYLSFMIEDYYTNYSTTRYSTFVDSYGGIDALKTETEQFTSGSGVVKHKILNDSAEAAGKTQKLKDIYKNNKKTSKLEKPSKVTQAESDALTYAFITFMKEHIEQ